MIPLWTSATPSLTCGWALVSLGTPWVAQRVWPMPVTPPRGSASQPLGQPVELARGAPPLDPAGHQRGDPGAVVAAILEPPQRIQQQGRRRPPADHPDDPAHGRSAPPS